MLREQHFGFVPFFFFLCHRCRLIPGNWKGSNLCGSYGKCGPQAGFMNMALYFGKLRRTFAWSQKGWFLLVHEPEPIVCEVKWSYVAYVREEYGSCAAKLSFHETMFLLSSGKLRSSRQAGRHHFQIEDGLKSISVKYMRQLPGPTANISSLSDK